MRDETVTNGAAAALKSPPPPERQILLSESSLDGRAGINPLPFCTKLYALCQYTITLLSTYNLPTLSLNSSLNFKL